MEDDLVDCANGKKRTIKCKNGEISLPCAEIKLVPIYQVESNNYNPNYVSKRNMDLLKESILSNGFCFPIVTIQDPETKKYVIIDGFHRWKALTEMQAVEIPIVILDHDISKRMEATIQFNRARGVHQTELMGDIVVSLINQGVPEYEISEKLGMEAEEVLRMKLIKGAAEAYKTDNYSRSWDVIDDG